MQFSIACATALVFGISSIATATDPCAEFASQVKNVYTGYDAELFLRCLKNVPFKSNEALKTMTMLRRFLGLNSHTAYHVDPPTPELELEPFSVNETIEKIELNIAESKYANNWAFDRDVVQLFQSFRDGHTVYESVCTHGFMFVHPYSIAAISSSPEDPPEIYHMVHEFDTEWVAPVIGDKVKKINDKDALEYLQEFITDSPEELNWIDPDARFNDVMIVYPTARSRGRFAHRNMWSGEKLTITWENGTTTDVKFTVSIASSMVDKELLFNDTASLTNLCFSSSVPSGSSSVEKRASTTAVAPKGYPSTLEGFSEEYAYMTFALDDETVILVIRTFTPENLDSAPFVEAQANFLKKQLVAWKSKGYKRLIIDVTNNPGGKTVLPYDVMTQLFPGETDSTMVNMKYSPMAWAYLSALDQGAEYTNWFKPDGKNFSSMAEMMGPVYKDNGYYTNMMRTDYKEVGEELYGFDVASFKGTPLFSKENIAIVSNSLCASACHSFVEMMRNRGVRAFAYGGRPADAKKPMQPVGGTKGGKVVDYETAQAYLGEAALNTSVVEVAGNPFNWQLDMFPIRMTSLKVNGENKFREEKGLPLMFVYTPACQRFYVTKEMVGNVRKMWAHLKDEAWESDGRSKDCTEYQIALPTISKNRGSNSEGTTVDSEGNPVSGSGSFPSSAGVRIGGVGAIYNSIGWCLGFVALHFLH